MSVVKSKRNTSSVQFLETAQQLELYSLQKCVKFPKRYTFLFTQHITNSAIRISALVKKGNSIYPTNQHEAQMRKDCFIEANAELQVLIGHINTAYQLFPECLSEKSMLEWMGLVQQEAKLLSAVKKSDRERYKQLPV